MDHSPDPRVALCEPCVALCEPGVASGTDEPRVARSEPCVAQVFLQCTPIELNSITHKQLRLLKKYVSLRLSLLPSMLLVFLIYYNLFGFNKRLQHIIHMYMLFLSEFHRTWPPLAYYLDQS